MSVRGLKFERLHDGVVDVRRDGWVDRDGLWKWFNAASHSVKGSPASEAEIKYATKGVYVGVVAFLRGGGVLFWWCVSLGENCGVVLHFVVDELAS